MRPVLSVCLGTLHVAPHAIAPDDPLSFLSHAPTAQAGKLGAIEHLVNWVEREIGPVQRITDLDCTAPLREVSDIHACNELLDDETDLVLTGHESEKNPYFNLVEQKDSGYFERVKRPQSEVLARQAAPKVYALNGSVYTWHRHTLTKSMWDARRIKLHEMPRERSIDIDHPVDFDLVELLMKRKPRGPGFDWDG